MSTDKQGRSGLGLDAQVAALEGFRRSVDGVILQTYREVETGKGARPDRPELRKALAHARRSRATLVIPKLDRLARNVHFTSGLMESGVDFIACDNPHANKLTIHILAAIAEHEAEAISTRTKDALAAARARGQLLGARHPKCRRLSEADGVKGRAVARARRAERAAGAYDDLGELLRRGRREGLSLRAIAARLNAEGHTTRTGRPWSAVAVSRALRHLGLS